MVYNKYEANLTLPPNKELQQKIRASCVRCNCFPRGSLCAWLTMTTKTMITLNDTQSNDKQNNANLNNDNFYDNLSKENPNNDNLDNQHAWLPTMITKTMTRACPSNRALQVASKLGRQWTVGFYSREVVFRYIYVNHWNIRGICLFQKNTRCARWNFSNRIHDSPWSNKALLMHACSQRPLSANTFTKKQNLAGWQPRFRCVSGQLWNLTLIAHNGYH